MKQYFKIINEGGRLSFHTGSNQQLVSEGKSLQLSIILSKSTPERVAEVVVGWMRDIKNYNLNQVW